MRDHCRNINGISVISVSGMASASKMAKWRRI